MVMYQVMLKNLRETAETIQRAGLVRLRSMANGESVADGNVLSPIPSEASRSVPSIEEPLESRAPSNASSNEPHECPAPLEGDDVLRSSRKLESWDKAPSEDIATS